MRSDVVELVLAEAPDDERRSEPEVAFSGAKKVLEPLMSVGIQKGVFEVGNVRGLFFA